MNHLRDARLQQALAHAPDAQATPSTANKIAIKKLAAYAINPRLDGDFSSNNSTKPWWRRLWENAGRPSAPWNAAFATMLLGSIITLVWYEKDVPDAALAEKSEIVANAARPATPPVATLPPAVVAPPPEPEPPRQDKAGATVAAQPPPVSAARQPEAAQGGIKLPEAATKATAPRDLAKSKSSGGAAPPAPAPAPAPAAPAPAPAIAAAAAPTPLSRAVPGRARSQDDGMESPLTRLGNWTSAELSYQDRVVRLSRPQAQALVDQVLAQVAANFGAGSGEPQGAPALRLQLLDTNGNLAEFELWRGTFKWRRRGEAELIGTLSVDQAAALLQEGARLIPP